MHSYIYRMMEVCTRVDGPPGVLAWYTAHFIQRPDYQRLAGLWIAEPRMIVLDKTMANDPPTVSHEALHDILGGNAAHGSQLFQRCQIRPL